MEKFIASFLSLFITLDPIGTIPFYITFTHSLEIEKKKKIVTLAVLVCLIASLIFIYLGNFIFLWFKISFGDFLIGSGIVLLIFSITEFLGTTGFKLKTEENPEEIAIVPLATPLLAGPAFLTTCLISKNYYGVGITLISLICNMIISWFVLYLSERIVKIVGKVGINGIIKIFSLFLAALAIKFIREGVFQIISH